MNKIMIAMCFIITASVANAKTTTQKPVPVPPTRPVELNTNGTGALVTSDGVVVKAPADSNVTVDVDGKSVDVLVDGPDKGGLSNVLPWNWSMWK